MKGAQAYKAQRLYKAMWRACVDEKLGEMGALVEGWDFTLPLPDYMLKCTKGELPVDELWTKYPAAFDIDSIHQAVLQADKELPDLEPARLRVLMADPSSGIPQLVVLKTRLAFSLLRDDRFKLTKNSMRAMDLGRGSKYADPLPPELEVNWQSIVREAVTLVSWALSNDPAYWKAHKWLGVAMGSVGPMGREHALLCLRRALILEPDDAGLWNLAARGTALLHHFNDAVPLWMIGCKLRQCESAMRLGDYMLSKYKVYEAACSYAIALSLGGGSKADHGFSKCAGGLGTEMAKRVLADPFAFVRDWHWEACNMVEPMWIFLPWETGQVSEVAPDYCGLLDEGLLPWATRGGVVASEGTVLASSWK